MRGASRSGTTLEGEENGGLDTRTGQLIINADVCDVIERNVIFCDKPVGLSIEK